VTPPADQRRAALFLDRDGVINVEVDHLHRVEDVALIDGVAEAILRVNRAGVPVVVVTNQAGIGRGLYGEADFAAVTACIAEKIAPATIDATYHCPHHPDAGCECRKPKIAMLVRAAEEARIDLERSILVGDKRSDLDAARAAGCTAVLVRTGYGAKVEADGGPRVWDAIFDSLGDAVPWILDRLTSR
jgi:D-glycero-D-manno-heptose 1,7-bisphosphate phosphatase